MTITVTWLEPQRTSLVGFEGSGCSAQNQEYYWTGLEAIAHEEWAKIPELLPEAGVWLYISFTGNNSKKGFLLSTKDACHDPWRGWIILRLQKLSKVAFSVEFGETILVTFVWFVHCKQLKVCKFQHDIMTFA